jgi:D-amino-acid dehydrogenase
MPQPSPPNHIVVIGAGIIGVNIALALQERGFAVTILDERPPGTATSKGNAGCFATAEITPISAPGLVWSVPRMLLDPLGPLTIRWRNLPTLAPWLWRFWRSASPAQFEQATRALASVVGRLWEDYEPVLAAAGLTDLVRRDGALFVYETERGFEAAGHEWELRLRYGVRAERVDAAAIRDLEPALAPIYRDGYFVTDWGHTLDPHRLVAGLADHFCRQGGTIRQARVTGFGFSGGAPRSVLLEGGEAVAFDQVVVAAGAWSKTLCAALGHKVPLDTERGYNTTLPHPGVALRRPVCPAERSFLITPMAMGLRIGGAVELASLEAPPNFARAKALLALGRYALPGLNTEGGTEWMGFRPSTPDSLPVIGRSPTHANVLFAFGHGHLGLTQGATTGRLIGDLAAGRPSVVDLAPFRIDRF